MNPSTSSMVRGAGVVVPSSYGEGMGSVPSAQDWRRAREVGGVVEGVVSSSMERLRDEVGTSLKRCSMQCPMTSARSTSWRRSSEGVGRERLPSARA